MLLVVLLVLGGLGAAGYVIGWPRFVQSQETLLVPDQVSGIPKVTDPAVYQALGRSFGTGGNAPSLYIRYQAPDDPAHSVTFAGRLKFQWRLSPSAFTSIFYEIDRTGATANAARKVAPGSLGGIAECARASADGIPAAVCAWQDYGGWGVLIFLNRTPDDGAVLMRAIRPQIVHRRY